MSSPSWSGSQVAAYCRLAVRGDAASTVFGAVSRALVRLSSLPLCPSFLLYSSIVPLSCPPPPPPLLSPSLTPTSRSESAGRVLAPPPRLCFGSIVFCFPRHLFGDGVASTSRPLSRRDLMMCLFWRRPLRAEGAAGGPERGCDLRNNLALCSTRVGTRAPAVYALLRVLA